MSEFPALVFCLILTVKGLVLSCLYISIAKVVDLRVELFSTFHFEAESYFSTYLFTAETLLFYYCQSLMTYLEAENYNRLNTFKFCVFKKDIVGLILILLLSKCGGTLKRGTLLRQRSRVRSRHLSQ